MLISYVVGTILRLFYPFFCENNMNRFRKQFDVQNVLKIIQGDDSERDVTVIRKKTLMTLITLLLRKTWRMMNQVGLIQILADQVIWI